VSSRRRYINRDLNVERISNNAGLLVESPLWDHRNNTLYWVDIHKSELWSWSKIDQVRLVARFDGYVSGVWLARGGNLVVACEGGIGVVNPETGKFCHISGAPNLDVTLRFNDGAVDKKGRLLLGTMGRTEADYSRPVGELYRISYDGQSELLLTGLTISNGADWSRDGKILFVADSMNRRILTVPYEAKWPMVADECQNFPFPSMDGLPDGLCVRSDGALVVASILSGQILVLSSSGETLEEIDLPVSCPTACCFGGPDLSTLFVTTSTHILPPEHMEELAGSPLALEGHGFGLQANIFGELN